MHCACTVRSRPQVELSTPGLVTPAFLHPIQVACKMEANRVCIYMYVEMYECVLNIIMCKSAYESLRVHAHVLYISGSTRGVINYHGAGGAIAPPLLDTFIT